MADKDTLNLIKFKFGSFQSIKDLSSKDQSSFYFANDKPTFYNAGLWYGVSSLTSSVNEETGEVTLTINGDLGEDWKGSQPVCKFVAGMTTEQKDNLKMVVDFVNSITSTEGEDTQTVIDKWNEIISFLEGFKETDVLLDRIVTLETNVTNLQNTTITGGDGLKGGGNLLGNRTIAMGTPSTITDSTINEAKGTTHTHAIDEASTEQRGIVQLNDSLTSESTDQALTARQGKVLNTNVKSITDLVNDMFEKVTDNGKTYIKTKYGFASEQFVSAGGTDDTESGGGGGANLTQMWESLQHNNDTFKDRLINVAHIPTLTTGKISDFVSATQAIADTAVANKADKDKVVDLTSNQTISGEKSFKMFYGHSSFNILGTVNSVVIKYGETGGWDGGYMIKSGDKTLTTFGVHGANRNPYYAYVALNGEVGNTNPSFKFYEGGKLTHKTLDVQESAHTNLVTNLNADMVDGYDSLSLFTSETIRDVNAPNKKADGSWIAHLGYNCSNVPSTCDDGKIVHFSTSENAGTSFQLASSYYGNTLFFRSGNLIESSPHYLYNRAWKKVAFTDKFDNYLPLTGGTLTGALTVNAPINNTGALKLLGAGEVSSTGMAVGSGAKALGKQSRALAQYSYAGLRTGDSTYPYASINPYDLQPFTVNGNTVYGVSIPIGGTVKYTYNNVEYSAENTTSTTQVLVLITAGADFKGGVVKPYNKCALTYSGASLSYGRRISGIKDLSGNVKAVIIYTWVGSSDESDFISSFKISSSDKLYAFRGNTSSSGETAIAIGDNSVANGKYSVASGPESVASGSFSMASGYYSVASGSYSMVIGPHAIASGNSSVASGYESIAIGNYSAASGYRSVASGSHSKAFGQKAIADGSGAMAFGELSQAKANLSFVFAYSGISARVSQTVLGRYNEEDVNSLLVIGSGTSDTARKNVFTVDSNGYVRMGNRLHIGVGGQNEVYLHSDVGDQLYVHTSAGIPFLIQGDFIRRGSSAPKTTLGTDQYKWFNVFTEALKIADARLTYDTGTLTIDKALKTTSTLTATQGEFANYVKIGNATISWNPKGYLEINEGLASHKFISAGGVVTGDAGGGGGGLSLTDMWVSLNGNIDAYGKSKIHIDHIPLDVILSHDSYKNDVANRINTFNYSNSSSFTSAVKALIVADNIPTLNMSKIDGLETTLTDIGTVVQNNYDNLNERISTLQNGTIADHEARIKALEKALTWQTV